eukprot:3740827-Ditylum_brightwellii.AAC.2
MLFRVVCMGLNHLLNLLVGHSTIGAQHKHSSCLHFFQPFCMDVGGRHINTIIPVLLVIVRTPNPILAATCDLFFRLDSAPLWEVITAAAAISAAAVATTTATTSTFSSVTSTTGLILLELVLK